MMKSGHLRDELKHVRLIHFSLTALGGTILYLVLSAWSAAPEIQRELNSFGEFIRKVEDNAVSLEGIDADATGAAETRILSAFKLSGKPLRWKEVPFSSSKPSFKSVESLGLSGLAKDLPIAKTVETLSKARWRFLLPSQLDASWKDMDDWVAKQLTGSNTSGPFLARFVMGTAGKEGPGNTLKATLNTSMWVKGNREMTMGEVFEFDQEFELQATLKSEEVSLPKDWMERRYPLISRNLAILGEKPLQGALTWAVEQRTKGIEGLKPSILGVEISANHAGSVGPGVLVLMMGYLLAYLSHLRAHLDKEARGVPESVGYFSPWLGTMEHLSGVILLGLTTILLPTTAIFLALWRLLGWSLVWCVLASAVAGFAPGFWIVKISRAMADRRVVVEGGGGSSDEDE